MQLLNDMMLFVSVVQNKSFSTAAKKNGMTTAALSKRITKLEKQLAARLLNRTTRKLILTEIGQILYNHCEKIASDVEVAAEAVSQAHSEPKGILKICCPTNFANLQLSYVLATFVNKHPLINIEITLDDRRLLPFDEGFDIIIRSGDMPERNVVARQIALLGWSVCASPQYFKTYGTPVHPNDLEKHNCIEYFYRQTGRTWYFYRSGVEYKVKTKGNIDSNNAQFIKSMTLTGAGIALFPTFMVTEELRSKKLKSVLHDYQPIGIPVYAVYQHRSDLPKKTRLFIDFMCNHFEKNKVT